MKRICIIPLRKESKRLKDKNITDFYGKPIFWYPTNMAFESRLFDEIIIATAIEYIQVVNDCFLSGVGANGTTIKKHVRKSENSRDESPLIDLVREITVAYNLNPEDKICILYSTSVLTIKEHLERGFERLGKGDVDCVFPIIKQDYELYYSKNYVSINPMAIQCNAKHADAWFIFNLDKILKSGDIIQEENGYIELKDYECQEVHTQEDIEDLKRKCWLKENYHE